MQQVMHMYTQKTKKCNRSLFYPFIFYEKLQLSVSHLHTCVYVSVRDILNISTLNYTNAVRLRYLYTGFA